MRVRWILYTLAAGSVWIQVDAYLSNRSTIAEWSERPQFTEDGSKLHAEPPKWDDPGWRILEKTTTVRFDERGGWEETRQFSYKALTEEGAKKLIKDQFNYDSTTESVTLDDLATVKADGRVLPVDPAATLDRTIDSSRHETFLDDKRVKVVVFPDVTAGDTVRGRVTWHARGSQFASHFARFYVHDFRQPQDIHRVVIDSPARLVLRSKAVGAQEKVETKAGRVIRTVSFDRIEPRPLTEAAAIADAAPHYEVSTFASWADVAKAVKAKNERAAQPDAEVAAKARELVAGASDRRERIKRLYDWVASNIRYVAIETGFGGFESMSAHATYVNRFGDCKAHATLLKAMMAAIGEPADMVLVDSGAEYQQPELPTPYFTHAILYAPSLDLYMDATSNRHPFGALPSLLADKTALDIETGRLTRIPVAAPADVKLVSETHIDFASDGTAKAHTTMTGAKGGEALRREWAGYLQQVNAKAQAAGMLQDFGIDGAGDFRFGDPRDLSKPFEMAADYQFNLHSALDNLPKGVRLAAPVDWAAWLSANIFHDRIGVATSCVPMDITDMVTVTLPQGFSAANLPESRTYEEDAQGHTALGDVTAKIAYQVRFEATGREIKQTTHATFAFSRGLCDAQTIERVWRAAAALNAYRWQAVPLTSSNLAAMRLWVLAALVKAHNALR